MNQRRALPLFTVLVLGLAAAYVVAGPGTANQRFIPYTGFLEQDGAAVGQGAPSTVALTFRLFNVATGGAALATVGPVNVEVTDGRFGTNIGPVAEGVFDAPRLFLELAVGGVVIPTRQEILAVPYAFHGEVGKPFVVGDLKVTGTVQGDLRASGNIRADGVVDIGIVNANFDGCYFMGCPAGTRFIAPPFVPCDELSPHPQLVSFTATSAFVQCMPSARCATGAVGLCARVQ